jgi:rhamnose utilization protein RhaD (predicted bifunctional aldolase and dehydrogenase)
MNLLRTLTDLSHTFGTEQYVLGGGGNTSAKDPDTLWVKPSGTTLAGMTPETFAALDREKIAELFTAQPPDDATAREAMVKDIMNATVRGQQAVRPSVEAPLHDSFQATFVVHTHPALVNGLCCSQQQTELATQIFPEAMWVDYTDPGYTLCMEVRRELQAWRDRKDVDPPIVLLGNHGIFVAAEMPGEIQRLYDTVFDTLAGEYERADIAPDLPIGPPPSPELTSHVAKLLAESLGDEAACIAASGPFNVAPGPLSPDHIVYARSFPLIGEPTAQAVAQYRDQRGLTPRIIAMDEGVFAIGATQKEADLALSLAVDAAMVVQLAGAFGGPKYLDDRQRSFIENWEVEAYRKSQAI